MCRTTSTNAVEPVLHRPRSERGGFPGDSLGGLPRARRTSPKDSRVPCAPRATARARIVCTGATLRADAALPLLVVGSAAKPSVFLVRRLELYSDRVTRRHPS
jgi:hypothetical protein